MSCSECQTVEGFLHDAGVKAGGWTKSGKVQGTPFFRQVSEAVRRVIQGRHMRQFSEAVFHFHMLTNLVPIRGHWAEAFEDAISFTYLDWEKQSIEVNETN